MTKNTGKNVNKTDESSHFTISVGSSVAVTLVSSLPVSDPLSMEILVTNDGNHPLWVRKRSAASDNDKDGRRISPGQTKTIVSNSEIYTGEISALFDSGGFKDVMVEII